VAKNLKSNRRRQIMDTRLSHRIAATESLKQRTPDVVYTEHLAFMINLFF